jgi:hypothetical protein
MVGWGKTYDLIVAVSELLAHELVGPLLDALAAFTLDTGDDERHGFMWSGGKGSFGCRGKEVS